MYGTATWVRRLGPGLVAGAVLLLLAACGGGDAGKPDPRLAVLSPDSLALWMEEGRSFALLDVRPDSLFEAARIAGSIHAYGLDFESLRDVIPPEVDTPVVWVSEDGRRPLGAPDRAAEAAGYLRVLWLEGGLRAWVAGGRPTVGSRIFPR